MPPPAPASRSPTDLVFVADESVDKQIADGLRRVGYEVLCVWELDPGLADEDVLALAVGQGAVLITADKDFGEIVFRQRRAAAGVLLIRLAGLSQHAKATLVVRAVQAHSGKLRNAFTVVSPGHVRVRSTL
jgi:predicted nuclease of predicted toxin-antitoxin system